MNSAQVGIFEERDQVSLDGFLESTDGRALEAKIRFEVLSDFTNKALEGQLADQKLSGLLVATDLTKSDSTLKHNVSDVVLMKGRVNRDLPGLYLWGFLTPPVEGAALRAALEASCLRGALPPVDLPKNEC